jgi:hypothetical protein
MQQVVTIQSCSPFPTRTGKTMYKIEFNGKQYNTFEDFTSFVGQNVEVVVEQNDKGFWNVRRPRSEEYASTPKVNTYEKLQERKLNIDSNRDDSIQKQVAIKEARALVSTMVEKGIIDDTTVMFNTCKIFALEFLDWMRNADKEVIMKHAGPAVVESTFDVTSTEDVPF